MSNEVMKKKYVPVFLTGFANTHVLLY